MRYIGLPIRLVLGIIAIILQLIHGMIDPFWWDVSIKRDVYKICCWVWNPR